MPTCRYSTLIIVLGFCALSSDAAKIKDCTVNFPKDFKSGHPLILKSNTSEFFYPDGINDGKIKIPMDQVAPFRLVCPGGSIFIKTIDTNRSQADLECSSKGKFRFVGDNSTVPIVFQLKDVKCNVTFETNSRSLPPGPGKLGLPRSQIGLALNKSATDDFVTAIDEIVAGIIRGQPINWARAKITSGIDRREKKKFIIDVGYRKGILQGNLDMDEVYVKDNQRNSLLDIFNDTEIVDKYLPATGNNYFVQGQLISNDDLFYEVQQGAANIYDNIIPIWISINNGNWKIVADLIRSFAYQTINGLDVWSGGYQQLYIDDDRMPNFVELTYGVRPPQFLYKYVHDSVSNKGLVFITLNNPYIERLTSRDIICDKYSSCDIQYPDFLNTTKGYTYCCRLEDFRYYANLFGLPNFPDAGPLI